MQTVTILIIISLKAGVVADELILVAHNWL